MAPLVAAVPGRSPRPDQARAVPGAGWIQRLTIELGRGSVGLMLYQV
jgi:hypothetical protein